MPSAKRKPDVQQRVNSSGDFIALSGRVTLILCGEHSRYNGGCPRQAESGRRRSSSAASASVGSVSNSSADLPP
ncbi:MAG: hypothetical protein R2912_05830 [Eubacteriales bacterium]